MSKCDYCNHVEMCGWRKDVEEQGCEFFDDGNKWIPCEERLPEATGFYICTVNMGLFDVRTMKFEMLAEGGYRWLLMNGSEVFPSLVLAWMPLPKPYMKGADDE